MNGLKVLTAEEQVANILAADARRVRRLTWATVFMLMPPIFLSGILAHRSESYYELAIDSYTKYRSQRPHPPVAPGATPEHIAISAALEYNAVASAGLLSASLAAMVFAATILGAVLLVHASRRATLRQIQASLADISVQLAALNKSAA